MLIQKATMSKQILLNKLDRVAYLGRTSKLNRMLHNPVKYINAIVRKKILYPRNKKEVVTTCNLFFGNHVKVILPSSTDLYLTGGKTHDSEIRLARFLINNLESQQTFWDIGAHYGYFTLLAQKLVGEHGKVVCVEAAPATYNILQQNTQKWQNITLYHNAVSDKAEPIIFHELPNLYSEFNTTDISQFENEDWFKTIQPKQISIDAITLNTLYHKHQAPDIIKIDVEGAESAVISGGDELFKHYSPVVILEFLEPKRGNQSHKDALALLLSWGYRPNIILEDGSLKEEYQIEAYLINHQMDSDNIVFVKK